MSFYSREWCRSFPTSVLLLSLAGCSNVAAALPFRLPRPNFMTSHYETLGIPKEASAERIKRSYRKLVKLYHPDQFPSRSREQAEAEKRMRDINVAYSVLLDPEHCSRCGKLTGHWQSKLRKAAFCPVCI